RPLLAIAQLVQTVVRRDAIDPRQRLGRRLVEVTVHAHERLLGRVLGRRAITEQAAAPGVDHGPVLPIERGEPLVGHSRSMTRERVTECKLACERAERASRDNHWASFGFSLSSLPRNLSPSVAPPAFGEA